MEPRGVTSSLAAFVVDPALDDLPAAVRHAVRRSILDHVAVAVAGSRHPGAIAACRMIGELGVDGRCAIIGTTLRADAVNAAMANGISAHIHDWDDTILPTRMHLSATLLPSLLALGELHDLTLDDIGPAFAVGFELEARLCLAIFPSVHDRRWHNTAIVGAIGSAAACARLLRLSAVDTTHAIGLAANSAAGFAASYGSMSKSLNIGRAAALGLQSALLAHAGMRSHDDMLGKGRFLEMYSSEVDAAPLLSDLGTRWSVLENGFKLYPCGVVAHAMIDAVRDLRGRAGTNADIRTLRVRVPPAALQLMGFALPTNELEAKFSLRYVAAATWVFGTLSPAAFDDATIAAPEIRRVMELVEISDDATLPDGAAIVTVEDSDGHENSAEVSNARGTALHPLSNTELIEKFDIALSMGGVAGGIQLANRILTSALPIRRLIQDLA